MRASLPLARVVMPLLALLLTSAWQEKEAHTEEQKPVPKEVLVEPGTPKAWALLTSSVLFERNGDRHDTLAGSPATEENVESVRKMLEDTWKVRSAKELGYLLTWLDRVGHRMEFERVGRQLDGLPPEVLEKRLERVRDEHERNSQRVAAEHWARAGEHSIVGWDLGRYVALCRWGYACGYLTEDEAWARIMPVAEKAQKTFASWEELAENYCLGREFWRPGHGEDSVNASQKLSTDEKSPWKTTPWELDLHEKAAK